MLPSGHRCLFVFGFISVVTSVFNVIYFSNQGENIECNNEFYENVRL